MTPEENIDRSVSALWTTSDSEEAKLFTKQQYDTLLRAVVPTATDEEAIRFIRWAEHIRVGDALIREILKGKCLVTVNDDDSPVFYGYKSGQPA